MSINGWRSTAPIPSSRSGAAPRNDHWHHMYNADIISMPDKWEYPWYAAWDLAFHVLSLTLVDENFGKQQLDLMLRDSYLHPSGQTSRLRVELRRRQSAGARLVHDLHVPYGEDRHGARRHRWLERASKAAAQLHMVGEPQGPHRQQRLRGRLPGTRQHRGLRPQRAAADRGIPGAGRWHGLDGVFCQNMLEIAVRTGADDRPTRRWASSSSSTFLWIASSMMRAGEDTGCGTKRTGSSTTCSDSRTAAAQRLKVRSMVGLLPLCAVTVFEGEIWRRYPETRQQTAQVSRARPELRAFIHDPVKRVMRAGGSLSILNEDQAPPRAREDARRERVLEPLWHPLPLALSRRASLCVPMATRNIGCRTCRRSRTPACSAATPTGAGPIWMPVNVLIIRALLQYYAYYGNDFTVECPTGSGRQMNLYQVAEEIRAGWPTSSSRQHGRRPVYGAPGSSRRTRTGATPPVLRVLPRRQRRRPRRQPPDRLDRSHRPRHASVCDHHRRAGARAWKSRRGPWRWSSALRATEHSTAASRSA